MRQMSGSMSYLAFLESTRLALDRLPPVAMLNMTVPVAFAGTDSLPGLKLQEEFVGSEPHANVKVPVDPFRGVSARVY
jgi:hypothetical protein